MRVQGKPIGCGDILKLRGNSLPFKVSDFTSHDNPSQMVYGRVQWPTGGEGPYEGYHASELVWPDSPTHKPYIRGRGRRRRSRGRGPTECGVYWERS